MPFRQLNSKAFETEPAADWQRRRDAWLIGTTNQIEKEGGTVKASYLPGNYLVFRHPNVKRIVMFMQTARIFYRDRPSETVDFGARARETEPVRRLRSPQAQESEKRVPWERRSIRFQPALRQVGMPSGPGGTRQLWYVDAGYCAKCRKRYKIPPELSEKKVWCPKCNIELRRMTNTQMLRSKYPVKYAGELETASPCRSAEKWKGRPYKAPWPRWVYRDAARYVMDRLESLMEQDSRDRAKGEAFLYFEPDAKVVGVWGTGSGVAGRWTGSSDIDVWVQMSGLTHQGEKYADQDIHEYFLRYGDCITTPDGKCRTIDVIILDYPPSQDYCTYRLEAPTLESLD